MMRRLMWLAAWLMLLLANTAAAQASLSLVDGDPGTIPLRPHVALWLDATNAPDPAQLLADPAVTFAAPAGAKAMTPGYSAAAYWLRLRLHNNGPRTQERVLVMAPTRLESVALFWRAHEGAPWQVERAGTDHPFSARALPVRESAFLLRLAPGESRELMVRVASRGAIALAPSLWQPAALLADQRMDVWAEGMLLSMPLLLALLAAGLYLALRLPTYGLIAAYLLTAVLYEAGMRGIAFMWLWPSATDWAQRSLGVFGAAATVLQVMTMSQVLGLRQRQPLVHRALCVAAALDLVAMGLCLWGDYRQGTQLAGVFNLALSVLAIIASARALRGGGVTAAAWSLALLCQQLGILPRYLSLTGVMPDSAIADFAPALACAIGGVLVLGATLWQLHVERERHAQTLEAAVRERTSELALVTAQAQAGDAAKGRLLGYIGHDLRAPLASIVQLTRQLGPDHEFELNRRAIEHSGLMLLDTIDELQRFAREPDAQAAREILAAPQYLHGLLLDVTRQAQALARSGGNTLRLDRAEDLPAVAELDAKRLRQVLFNLLSNASKFTRDGVIIMAASVGRSIVGTDGLLSDRLLIRVTDTGTGIAFSDQEMVFDPFVRAGDAGRVPGLGLGLSIARQAVRDMGGDLTVRSRPGHGSSFTVDMPLRTADEDHVLWPAAVEDEALREAGTGRRAWVIDPCAAAREALAERLALAGFEEVLQASTLDEARQHGAEMRVGESLPLLVVLEPRALPDGLDGSASILAAIGLGGDVRLLACSARPADPSELTKPVPEDEWRAALSDGR